MVSIEETRTAAEPMHDPRPAGPGSDRREPAAAVARELAFWGRYARTAHLLNLVIVLVDMAYMFGTWRAGSHRQLLLGLNLFGLVGLLAAVALVPERKLAASPHREVIFAAWCVFGSSLIVLGMWADGGVSSPLAWLLPLSVMFTAVVHRPALVVLSGGLAVVGFAGLAAVDGALATYTSATLLQVAYLATLTFAAASGARHRWALHDDQVALHRSLSRLADVDGLTGLLNHRAFHVRLKAEIATFARLELPVTLLLVDLDHFKGINDRFGHSVGDEVLRKVGAAMRASIRDSDIAGRVGGEEFAVFLGPTPASEAHQVAERIRVAVAEIVDPEPVTASIGLSVSDPHQVDAATLVDQADKALYAAKRQGRNRTCWLRVA